MNATTRNSKTQLRHTHGTPVVEIRTNSYRQMAIDALIKMIEQAESDQVYGVIGVEVGFQNGQASYIRRQTNLTEQ